MSSASDGGPDALRVWVVSPGGRAGTGGICRMVDHQAAAWDRNRPAMRVLDSGGMSSRLVMIARFAGALATVACGGLARRFDVLDIHVAAWGSVVRKAPFVLLGRALGIPAVLHLHAADFETFHASLGPIGRRLVRTTFRAADAVIVLGGRARAHLVAQVGVRPNRVQVIVNAVPHAPLPPRTDGPFCRLLFLGALTERKGLDDLFEALAAPDLARLPWRLSLIGNGDRSRWHARAAALGLGTRVSFEGYKPSEDARRALASADLLVLPSRDEGLPMAVLEAMAAGLAVIATDVGDVREAVLDGVTGSLVPARDPAALAAALVRLIASPAVRQRQGRAGRQRFVARFDIDLYDARLADLFASLAPSRRAPRPILALASPEPR